MSDKIGLLTGSFDPITLGHMDMIERAHQLFDRLYVGILYNKEKSGLFDLEAREAMVAEAVSAFPGVTVVTSQDQLTVELARELGVTHLVRGLRNATDLEYEANLAYFNHYLDQEVDSVFFLTADQYRHVSSSRVRELIHFRAPIADFVPASVVKEVEKRFGNQ